MFIHHNGKSLHFSYVLTLIIWEKNFVPNFIYLSVQFIFFFPPCPQFDCSVCSRLSFYGFLSCSKPPDNDCSGRHFCRFLWIRFVCCVVFGESEDALARQTRMFLCSCTSRVWQQRRSQGGWEGGGDLFHSTQRFLNSITSPLNCLPQSTSM